MDEALSPEKILQTGMAFWASKTLLSAIEMGVFTELVHGPESSEALSGRLGLHHTGQHVTFWIRWSLSAS